MSMGSLYLLPLCSNRLSALQTGIAVKVRSHRMRCVAVLCVAAPQPGRCECEHSYMIHCVQCSKKRVQQLKKNVKNHVFGFRKKRKNR